MRFPRASLWLTLCLFVFAPALIAAQAVVVKVDKPVAIDQPGQWPAITAVHNMANAGDESATWIACYDANTLYLLVRVVDGSPMLNSTSPFDAPMAIKGGDAVGFCFGPAAKGGTVQRIVAAKLDGQGMAVVYRPTSDAKKPYRFASPVSTYVMEYVAPLPEVKVAFHTIDQGYAVGVAIPWKVLGYTVSEDLEFPFDAQVIFSDPAGVKNIATAWWHSRGNGPACTVDLPSEARLYPDLWGSARLYASDPGPQEDTAQEAESTESMVIDPEGLTAIPITFTLPRASKVSLVITNDSGWIVAEPLRAEAMSAGTHTITWNGRGYRDMPLAAGTYHWRLGYFDGVRSKFLGAAGNSGRPPYPSADKKGSIGGVHLGPCAVASDAGGVYLLHGGEEGEHGLRKIDAKGEVLWTHSIGNYSAAPAVASDGKRACMLAGWPELALVSMDAETGRDVGMGEVGSRIPLGDAKQGFAGLALIAGKAYVSVTNRDRILIFDLSSGKADGEITVPKPGRLCRLDDTHLLVISDTSVLRLDLATRASKPFINGLTAPTAIALAADGRVFIAESGDKQQIASFTAAGKRLNSLGKLGGRAPTVPVYDPMEFRNLVDLAVDTKGQLWFVEGYSTAPRRIGCLDAKGKWVQDYCGPVYCSSGMVIDLDDASTVYYHIASSWIKSHIGFSPTDSASDFTWDIQSIFYLSQTGTEVVAEPDLMLPSSTPSFAAGITFRGSNGKRYFWIDGEQNYTRGQAAALWVWVDDRWKPAGIQNQAGKPCWFDRNGDGLVQDDEYGQTLSPDGSWRWLDRDLILYGRYGSWKPKSIDARGVPDYAGGTYTPYAKGSALDYFASIISNFETGVSRPGADGAMYYCANIGNGQGRSFWDRASENKLIKVKDGKVEWWVGHHDAYNRTSGDATFVYNVCGVEDGVIVVSDVTNQYIVYTEDGLTLGWLLTDDKGRPRWVGDSYVSAESFSGEFVKDPKTGKYLLYCGASESCQVREVLGVAPSAITRLHGDLQLVSSLPRTTPMTKAALVPAGTWECSNGRFNGIDGDDWEWWPRSYETITIRDGKQVVADVRLRRDAGYLEVFADVLQSEGFHPLAAEAPLDGALLGDGLELLLGPMKPAGRTKAMAGDTRVVLSGFATADGGTQGIALAARPAGPDIPANPWLRPMATWGELLGEPAGMTWRTKPGLQPIPGARVALRARPDGKGFRLEAEIPLALFPELTALVPVTFHRLTTDSNHAIKVTSEERPDFSGPFRLNVAALTTDASGTHKRLPWMADGASVDQPMVMTPNTWGVANAAITVHWQPQPGASAYRVYRSTSAVLGTAKLLTEVKKSTTITDAPEPGTYYYWLTVIDTLGESQFLGPESIVVGSGSGEPRVKFSGSPAPGIPFPSIPDCSVFPGDTSVRNIAVVAKSLTATVSPAGATVTTTAVSEGQWRLALTLPTSALPDARYTVTLTASSGSKPITTTFACSTASVQVVGVRTQTAGTLEIDTTAEPKLPVAIITWPGSGSLLENAIGRSGYVLFRRNKDAPVHMVRAPFTDTFANDGFWYAKDGGTMRFDLKQADGSVDAGQDKDGRCYFGSVNSNAGTPGKPETYPGTTLGINVSDSQPHLLTVFSPSCDNQGAKERFTLQCAKAGSEPVIVEFNGDQRGAIIQFRFIGNATLTIQQTVGGMGSSNPGANCAALFLD